MDKFLRVCGIIFPSLIGIGIIAAAIFIPKAMILNSSAVDFIQQELPNITSQWDPDALLKNATPEFAGSASREEINQLWAKFRSLGKLKSHEDPSGGVNSQAMANGASGTFGVYAVQAQFENGKANIYFTLKRIDGGWKIYGFRVNSKIFLQ